MDRSSDASSNPDMDFEALQREYRRGFEAGEWNAFVLVRQGLRKELERVGAERDAKDDPGWQSMCSSRIATLRELVERVERMMHGGDW